MAKRKAKFMIKPTRDQMARKINDLQAQLDKLQWIPVEDKPKKEQYYYVTGGKIEETFVLWWSGSLWMLSEGLLKYNITKITHWKPIILPDK